MNCSREKINLMFHDVVNGEFPNSGFQSYVITSSLFESLVQTVVKINPEAEFTFDDGGACAINIVASILEKYNKRGVFFIITSKIGEPGFLKKEQIMELHQRGHLIASHSHTHGSNNKKRSKEDLIKDWKVAKEVLESIIHTPVKVASVPGGAVTPMVLQVMSEVGYDTLYTSEPTLKIGHVGNSKVIGRYGIRQSITVNELKSMLKSPWTRRKILLRWKLLWFSKSALGHDGYSKIKKIILKFKNQDNI